MDRATAAFKDFAEQCPHRVKDYCKRKTATFQYGPCALPCALGQEWCPECGHRKESHLATYGKNCCPVTTAGSRFPCGCEFYARKGV